MRSPNEIIEVKENEVLVKLQLGYRYLIIPASMEVINSLKRLVVVEDDWFENKSYQYYTRDNEVYLTITNGIELMMSKEEFEQCKKDVIEAKHKKEEDAHIIAQALIVEEEFMPGE